MVPVTLEVRHRSTIDRGGQRGGESENPDIPVEGTVVYPIIYRLSVPSQVVSRSSSINSE